MQIYAHIFQCSKLKKKTLLPIRKPPKVQLNALVLVTTQKHPLLPSYNVVLLINKLYVNFALYPSRSI